MSIFQDEPDEDSSPNVFQKEKDEIGTFLFQDEGEESAPAPSANTSMGPRQTKDLRVLHDEPDETLEPNMGLFADEQDEVGSDSTESAYLADCEDDCSEHQQQLVVQQLNLSFSTLNQFLSTQLGFHQARSQEQPRKKRCYNNQRRAAQAAESKRQRQLYAGSKKSRCHETIWFLGAVLWNCF